MLLRNDNLSGAAIFETRDVAKNYGGVKALRGVSLDIRPGEILGLCGENGSGKSTFLKIISGQIQPSSGNLFLDGEEVDFKNPLISEMYNKNINKNDTINEMLKMYSSYIEHHYNEKESFSRRSNSYTIGIWRTCSFSDAFFTLTRRVL